jgi:hypothetical protein
MKLTRSLLALTLSSFLVFVGFVPLAAAAHAADTKAALQRGYRTGYSDGYMAGYRDLIDNMAKDFTKHSDYQKADRAYNKDYGSLEDYRNGYQQGFEAGYETGFEKGSFESAVPENLTIRTAAAEPPAEAVQPIAEAAQPAAETAPAPAIEAAAAPAAETAPAVEAAPAIQKVNYTPSDEPVIIIPRDTELIIELEEPLSTDRTRAGDKFTAKVVSPSEIVGAIIEGRVSKVEKPGRIKKRSEMLLTFDRIVISERRWSNFSGILTEILPVKGDNVKRVDEEGTALGKRSYKGDGVKVGAATGTGLVIGAIAGGPVGAAVGAGVGAAFGVGAVIIERGKHINLEHGQQLRIKAAYETQIR